MSLKIGLPAVAAVVLISTPVFAATLTKTGEIKSIDAAQHKLVLSSGETFQLGLLPRHRGC